MKTIYDAKEKLWMNPEPHPFSDLKITQGELILNRLSLHGSKVGQINADNGHQMTFHEMRMETIRIAQNLQKRGFKSHQVFSFLAGNSEHLVPVVLASICLACPVAPLHPMLSKDEIARILQKIKVSVVFCDVSAHRELNEALKEVDWNVKVFTFGGEIDRVEPIESLLVETGNENNFTPVIYDIERDVSFLVCSSGTTGPSKSCCFSYSNSVFMPDIIDPNSIIFCDDSIYWTVAIRPIMYSIYNGATRVYTSKPFSSELLYLIEQYKITTIYISTFSLILCLKSEQIEKTDLSSVKLITFYGAKWPSTLGPTFRRYFPDTKSMTWYGMTEVGRVTREIMDNEGFMNDAELFEGYQVKIIDEHGNRCGPGVNGELCCKLKNEFFGYLNDPIANSCIDDERFIHTGDIGHFDEHRRFFIEDRKKNVINVFYFDGVILPSEMEETLLAMEEIKEACVVGIPVATGESLPAAVVVPKTNSKLTARDVFDLIAEKYPNRSRLRGGVYLVDSLPKTNSRKLIRKKITEMASEMFKAKKNNDPDIQSYLMEIPEEFRKMI